MKILKYIEPRPLSLLGLFIGYSVSLESETPKLIPREILFKQSGFINPQLSPDGTRLAYVGYSTKNVLNIWLRTLGKSDDEMITQEIRQGISQFNWSCDGQHILYFQDNSGDENYHCFSLDLRNRAVKDLTPFIGVKAQNLLTSPAKPNEILVGLNLRNSRIFDMYRIDLKTEKTYLDTKNPGDIRWWLTDSNCNCSGRHRLMPPANRQ